MERAYGADVVRGPYVEPLAYAEFLRGAIAEEGARPELDLAAQLAESRRDRLVREAEGLAGDGRVGAARTLAARAAATFDAPWTDGLALGARLAVDEAISADEVACASDRAVRVHVGLEEASARALLVGHAATAQSLASEVAKADPGAFGARAILATATNADVLGALSSADKASAVLGSATWVALGRELTHAVSQSSARAFLDGIRHAPIVPGDDVVERAAIVLAMRGLIGPGSWSPDMRIEMRAIGWRSEELAVDRDRSQVDERHQCLAAALDEPLDARAVALAERLSKTAATDPVVELCAALLRVDRGEITPAVAARSLVDDDPGNPVLAAAAFALALRAGDAEGEAHARTVFDWVSDAAHRFSPPVEPRTVAP